LTLLCQSTLAGQSFICSNGGVIVISKLTLEHTFEQMYERKHDDEFIQSIRKGVFLPDEKMLAEGYLLGYDCS